MAYLDELLQLQRYTTNAGQQIDLKRGQAYASFYNPVEVSAPSYVVPNPYTLTREGYRANEFAYSIMQLRASAQAQAHLRVMMDVEDGDDEEQINHELVKLLENPNPSPIMTYEMFVQMKRVTQDISGFCAFEIEYSNGGEPLALWYMTPYWCSFLRGQQEPLRAIRYQPWGLQPMDIPFKDEDGKPRILFFSDGENFDPLTDRVRFHSPLMAAFPQVQFDNAMTFFLTDFVKNGAKFAGLISVAQTIDESQAADYRKRWRAQHGGTDNWADPLILGEGASYTSMQMNFKDMAFPELDARTESRICNAFKIDPIVASAKAGMDVSSYNNKKEAQKDWYYNWVIPAWRSDASLIGTQLLPIYESDPDKYYCEFDLSTVYALKEDRDAQSKRAVELFKAKLFTKNEARKEVGAKAVPEGDDFMQDPIPAFGQSPFGNKDEDGKELPKDKQAEQDAKQDEERKFRKFAKQRVKEGKPEEVKSYQFKYHNEDEQSQLVAEFGITPPLNPELKSLVDALNRLAEQNERERIIVNVPQLVTEITVPVPAVTNVIDTKAASVNVSVPDKKRGKAIVTKKEDGSFEIEER